MRCQAYTAYKLAFLFCLCPDCLALLILFLIKMLFRCRFFSSPYHATTVQTRTAGRERPAIILSSVSGVLLVCNHSISYPLSSSSVKTKSTGSNFGSWFLQPGRMMCRGTVIIPPLHHRLPVPLRAFSLIGDMLSSEIYSSEIEAVNHSSFWPVQGSFCLAWP